MQINQLFPAGDFRRGCEPHSITLGIPAWSTEGRTGDQHAVREAALSARPPVSHFYEFTGKRSKDKWHFTKVVADWFCIAGLWRPVEGEAPAFTMLTCEPGPDVAPIHNRQIVVLDRSQWAAWLDPETAEHDLLKPSPAGSLAVEKVERKQLRIKLTAA